MVQTLACVKAVVKNYQRAEKIPQQYGIQEKRHNGIPFPGQIHFKSWEHTLSLAKRMFEVS